MKFTNFKISREFMFPIGNIAHVRSRKIFYHISAHFRISGFRSVSKSRKPVLIFKSGPTTRRYRWRHDQVLRVIAESIEKLRRGKAEGKPSKTIVFVKEGTSLPKSQSKGQKNLISTADDWKLDVDLNKKLVFPREIVITNLRPDIVLSSQKAKTVVMIETNCAMGRSY